MRGIAMGTGAAFAITMDVRCRGFNLI